MNISTRHRRVTRVLGSTAVVGALAMIGYGMLAVLFPYPRIAQGISFELVWVVANVGVIAGIAGWAMTSGARPRTLALAGAGLAVLGHAARIVVGLWSVGPWPVSEADATWAIVATIPPAFLGMILLGIATLVGRGPRDPQAWVPLVTVAAGLVAASLYGTNTVAHFIVLGVGWGTAWLLLGLALRRLPEGPARAVPLTTATTSS